MNSLAPKADDAPPKPTPSSARRWCGLRPVEPIVVPVGAALILAASYLKWWSIEVTEAWGFATGAACVWLVVRQHFWNWPIGLANNVFFFVLFFRSRLYADMGLQVFFFGLGVYGWINWRYGGANRTPLKVTRTTRTEWCVLALAVAVGTWGLRELLLALNGAAPLADSLTTVLSLAAQYLLCRKRLENWLLWIVTDVIYVPLYLSRGLTLTAVLYTLFLVMCVVGLREWWKSWRAGEGAA